MNAAPEALCMGLRKGEQTTDLKRGGAHIREKKTLGPRDEGTDILTRGECQRRSQFSDNPRNRQLDVIKKKRKGGRDSRCYKKGILLKSQGLERVRGEEESKKARTYLRLYFLARAWK